MRSSDYIIGLSWQLIFYLECVQQQPLKEPPMPDLFMDEEHDNLISDVSLYL